MAFSANTANSTTQSGNYITATVVSFTPAATATTWSMTATITQSQALATGQAAASVADTIGRAIFNTTRTATLTASNQIAHSWVTSISQVGVSATAVTITGVRYFLANGQEDSFQASMGDTMAIAQDENDLIQAGITGVVARQGAISYGGLPQGRTDVNWSQAPTTQIFLGTAAQAVQLVINGAFCIRGNTQIYQGTNAPTADQASAALTIGSAGSFCMGQAQTYSVGSNVSTRLVYPGVSWTCDTLSTRHTQPGTFFIVGYMALSGTYGGQSTTISNWTVGTNNSRLHFRKCRLWSARQALNNVAPNVFTAYGVITTDELELYGTLGLQREGSSYLTYSLVNTGGGLAQTVNGTRPPQLIRGYTNLGSQDGVDFRGYQGCLSGGTEVTNGGNMIISYDSPLGTNVYATSADASFLGTNQQTINLEVKRNLTITNTGSISNAVNYFKDVTRAVGTVGSLTARGAVLSVNGTQNLTQFNTGTSITAARSGTVVATDNIALANDRVYVATSGVNTSVLLGEVYTTNAALGTPGSANTVGRTGYDGGTNGLATTRVNRRGKDDRRGLRTNKDNYDIYSWSYNGAFAKVTDYSMNAGANGAGGALVIPLVADTDLTQQDVTVTAAYSFALDTARLYDYSKYYETAPGTIDLRSRSQRLELGGVDGTDPTATIANGGGGYLVYPVGSALMFNDILSGGIINNTGTSPFTVAATAVGPVRGSWDGVTSTYNYGDNLPATPTVRGAITINAGANRAILTTAKFDTLDFGTKPVNLQTLATAAGSWATVKTNNAINLGLPGTSASWTTTYIPIPGSTGVTVSNLGFLAPANVSTTVTTSVDAATHNNKIATALTAVMPAGTSVTAVNTASTIAGTLTLTFGSGFVATILNIGIGFTGNAATGSASSTLGTTWGFNGAQNDAAAAAAVIQTAWRAATGSTTATVTQNLTTATYPQTATFTLSAAPQPAGATAITFTATGVTVVTAPTVTGTTIAAGINSLNFVVPAVQNSVIVTTTNPVLGGTAVSLPVFSNGVNSTASTLGTTVYQSLNASSGINLLPLSGQIVNGLTNTKTAINFGTAPGTVIPITGNLTFSNATLTGTCNLNVGLQTYNLTLANCGTITTFPFIRTGSGIVFVQITGDTVLPATLPTGFIILQMVTVTVNLGSAINLQTQIKVAEAYTINPLTNVPSAVMFSTQPVVTAAGATSLTWTFFKNSPERFSFIAFVDKNLPVQVNSSDPTVTVSSVTAGTEENIDFGLTLPAGSDTIINGATVGYTAASAGGLTTGDLQIRIPGNADYSAVSTSNAKLLVRRILENTNATAWRRDSSRGVFPMLQSHFLFTLTGTILAGTTYGVSMYKAGATGTSNSIYIQLWNTDSLGSNFYDWNRGGAAAAAGVTFNLYYALNSPGATANITSQDILNISAGVNTGLTNTASAPLSLIARGIEKGSLLIPAVIPIPPSP